MDHLRIFGCPVYIRIPKDKRKKLDPTSINGIFFGYSDSSKAYRIYIMDDLQIEVSRDVIFDESILTRNQKMFQLTLMNKRYPFLRIDQEATIIKILHHLKKMLQVLVSMFNKLFFLKSLRDLLG